MEETYQKFFNLLSDIVDGDGTWQEKKAALKAEMESGDESNLTEFLSWFESPNAEAESDDE